jgi:hypothetical protein
MSNPTSGSLAVEVFNGGRLLPFTNVESGSTECLSNVNLLTQVSPLIVSLTCQLKLLNVMKPLIELIKGLPTPSPTAITEFLAAAAELAPCLTTFTPTGVLPFLRDLLCLEIRSLNCVSQNLRSVIALRTRDSATADSKVQSVFDSYVSTVGILNLASGLFAIAGVTIPTAPALPSGSAPASLNADQMTVAAYIASLQAVVDALGGCH